MARYYIYEEASGDPQHLVESFTTDKPIREFLYERIEPRTLDGVRDLVFDIQGQKLVKMLGRGELHATLDRRIQLNRVESEEVHLARTFISPELASVIQEAETVGPFLDVEIIPRHAVRKPIEDRKWG